MGTDRENGKGKSVRLKCPSCGEVMRRGTPYVTWTNLDEPEEYRGFGSGDLAPEWIRNLPIAGHRYSCESCPCKVDIPLGVVRFE